MMKKIYVLIYLILGGFITNVNAQIAAWEFNTLLGSEATVAATTLNANLAATSVSRGPGLLTSVLGNAFSSTDFTLSGTFANAVTNGDYLQFTIAANATYKASLSTLDVNFRRSSTGPNTFQWQYSLDGFATTGVNIGAAISFTSTTTNGVAQAQIDLSVIPALQNVANPSVITFRLYGYGATAITGTFALGRLPGNDLALGGTVTLISGATPDIVLSSPNPAVAAGNIAQGSTSTTNNPIYRFDLAVTTADATLNGVTINTAGTYAVADITNFKCWYSSDATFSPGTDVLLSTLTPVATAGPQVFPSFTNQSILNGANGYFFITADVTCAATLANTISVNAITTADISFVSGNKSGTAFAGDVQTIIAAMPNDVTAPAASVANASSSLSWVTPTGCYDEILIVARATTANDGVPTGDGTAYTGNAAYGAGTALGSGFVVYKGPSASPQPVTGLTNGTPYYYKFFTRLGTTWTTGVEVNATPALVTLATDYFRSVASGSWNLTATWESSADSISWIPATLIPGVLAAHVVIQSPDSVFLAANTTTANLTVSSGAVVNAITFTMSATNRFNLLGTASFYQGGTPTFVPGLIQQVLAPTSNYHYNGVQNGLNSGTYPEFGNFIWEPTATTSGTFQNTLVAAPFNLGLVIRGDMTINIQGATPREIRFATGTTVTRNHTIDGNLNIISSSSVAVITNGGLPVLSTVTVGGNINISAGILQGTSSAPATNGNAVLNLKGNINNTGGTIQTGASTAGLFSLNYIGTIPQSINNTGGTFTFTANQKDTINNTSTGLTLNTPITHNGTIEFIDGVVTTTAVNLLTMGAGSTVIGASNASYVSGPVKKIGNTPFTFPVGKANGYVPIDIDVFIGGTTLDEFTAEYIRSSARLLGPITAGPGLDHVSGCDYWTLNKGLSTPTSVDVKAYWSANNVCGLPGSYIDDLPTLTMAHFDGAGWDSYPVTPVLTGGSTVTDGSITWPGVTVFSPFSLASSTFSNPMPITINYFNGTRSNGSHLLNWKVTCVSTPSATIEMERSTDGRNYNPIYSIFATAVRCQQPFNYTDNAPAKGINYYRLKMTDADGKITYSTTVTLINAVKGIDVMNIAPNPIVNGAFNVKISTAEKMQMELVITDMQGRILQKQSVSMIAGFNQIPMNVRNLAAGTYQLFGNTADGRTRVLRFVIQ